MSLTGSISNALSGLTATSRAAHLVSSNLANALNENFGRREIELASSSLTNSGGVEVLGARRVSDPALIADRRLAHSERELHSTLQESAAATQSLIGSPDDPFSLNGRLERLDTALRFAESDPGSEVRLKEVLSAASGLVQFLGDAQSDIQERRTRADQQIGQAVDVLNANLQEIQTINRAIVEAKIKGHETAGLLDQRQTRVDAVGELVAVREMQRADGSIALLTQGGVLLVEGTAREIQFTTTNLVQPHMSLTNGLLGDLQIDGDAIGASGSGAALSGGRLEALFNMRDTDLVQAQSYIDEFSASLADRFNDLPTDSTLTPSLPGLFTDAGARVDPSGITGLSGRLAVNTMVDPAAGGAVWRLRDGLYNAAEAETGNATNLTAMISGLSGGGAQDSLFDHAAEIASKLYHAHHEREQAVSFASARSQQLNERHAEMGVDTDAELQKLLAIETNYAANAKVLQTVDEMMNAILGIT